MNKQYQGTVNSYFKAFLDLSAVFEQTQVCIQNQERVTSSADLLLKGIGFCPLSKVVTHDTYVLVTTISDNEVEESFPSAETAQIPESYE